MDLKGGVIMECCSNSEYSNIDEFYVGLIKKNEDLLNGIIEEVKKQGIPFSCDCENIMVCSPVGNQVKYRGKVKANIILSGFCTAPNAAYKYLKEKQELKDEFWECRHSFNTFNMKNGIMKILESIGFSDPERVMNEAIEPRLLEEKNENPRFLFTQLLCMISKSGSSKAKEVIEILKFESKYKMVIDEITHRHSGVLNKAAVKYYEKSILKQANSSI